MAEENQHFTGLCNDYYSAYFIRPKKNRLAVLNILKGKGDLLFLVNPFVISFLKERKLKTDILSSLNLLLGMGEMAPEKFVKEVVVAIPGLKGRHQETILKAAAIAAYQEKNSGPSIERLVCDDAQQFY